MKIARKTASILVTAYPTIDKWAWDEEGYHSTMDPYMLGFRLYWLKVNKI